MVWLLDSGCTDHIVEDCNYYDNFVNLKVPIEVKVADGKELEATKLGNIKTTIKTYYNEQEIDLRNVYYVEGIKKNLSAFTVRCERVSDFDG